MATERTNHEKSRSDLNKELENVLKTATALASTFTSQEVLSSEITQNLCNIVEAIFIHGLRDPFFLKGSRYAKYPEPNFWPFVSKYSHRSITSQINSLNQIKSEIGKGRAWIRIVLNESSLEHYLQLLLSEQKAMSQFYNEWAFLRDSEQVDRMLGFVKSLSGIPINAAINSSFLNSWTPSPLILAGLMKGKPIKVGSLQTIHRKPSNSQIDSVEPGIPAINYNPPPVKPIPPAINKNAIMTIGSVSDDDNSSIYSHPSMLDPHEQPNVLVGAKEPVFVSQNASSLLIHRRTKRPRKSSRSSSESNSQGTKTHSETRSALESEMPQSVPNDVFSVSTIPDALPVESSPSTTEKETERSSSLSSESIPEIPYPTPEEEEPKVEETKKDSISSNLIQLEEEHKESFSEPFSSQSEEEKDVMDDLEACGITIPSNNEDSMLGTSLHDELMSALSFETPSSGNALSFGGAWAVPRQSIDNGDGDTSGILSTSSGSSGVPVSFGQALRSAMENHAPSEEDVSFGETLEEEEAAKKKISIQIDINTRLTTIANEIGLVAQDFRCPMCRKSIGPSFNFSKYEMCGVDGLYYCMDCTKPGGTYSIPARVLHSWDWEQKGVSDRGRAFIEANLERAIFKIDVMNPQLYGHISSLKNILKLRERLQLVSLYLFNCRESIADDFRKRIHPRDYLYKDVHLYSFMDLQNVRTGNLEKQLNGWLKYAIAHVMDCVLCRQKGFVCEICDKKEVIYPFNTQTTHRCSECFSVYHTECAVAKSCPKCARRSKYEVKESATVLPLD